MSFLESDLFPFVVYGSCMAVLFLMGALFNKIAHFRKRGLFNYEDLESSGVKQPLNESLSAPSGLKRSYSADSIEDNTLFTVPLDGRKGHEYLSVHLSQSDLEDVPGIFAGSAPPSAGVEAGKAAKPADKKI